MIGMQCPRCLRYRGDLTCDAFEQGIPQDVLSGRFDHRQTFKGEDKLFQPFPGTVLPEKISNLEAPDYLREDEG
jgi:hypothetical protein